MPVMGYSGGGRYSRIGVQTILKRPFPLGAPYHIHGCSNTNSEETFDNVLYLLTRSELQFLCNEK